MDEFYFTCIVKELNKLFQLTGITNKYNFSFLFLCLLDIEYVYAFPHVPLLSDFIKNSLDICYLGEKRLFYNLLLLLGFYTCQINVTLALLGKGLRNPQANRQYVCLWAI
jgi:hypothetical protein